MSNYYQPEELYLYSFKSHFWVERSIEVLTHFIRQPRQRYIYTLPFAFDTFDIVYDISNFFFLSYPYYYANVRHLSLSSTYDVDEFIYSNKISRFFPNLQTITLLEKPSSNITISILNKHQWILEK